MKFDIIDTLNNNEEVKDKPLDYFHDMFSEQWRAANESYQAAAKLALYDSVNVCGLKVTRVE